MSNRSTYNKEYYAANRDKFRERARRYRAASVMENREKQRKYYQGHATERRDYARERHYGISGEEYRGLLVKQKGRCAICRGIPFKQRLSVDPCHATNIIRGLLCNSFNNGLGRFKDDPGILRKAATYLENI